MFEAPRGLGEQTRDLVVDRMQRAMALVVPLIADAAISENWHEAK